MIKIKSNSRLFDRCCNQPNKMEYDIKHNPKPIELVPELRQCIEHLLWYVPGINSIQSYENYLIDNPIYSDIIFDIILESMTMSREKDVRIVDKVIESEDEMFYEKDICVSCQKMIFSRIKNYNKTGKKETITRAMLRHLRNSIAHGSFKVIDNLVFLKDMSNGNGLRVTAIIKVDILSLNKALKRIENPDYMVKKNIITRVFESLGFNIEDEKNIIKNTTFYPDIIINKNKKRYSVEIKSTNYMRIGYKDDIVCKHILQVNYYKDIGLIPILIYDNVKISDKARQKLKEEEIIFFDKKDIIRLMGNEDIIL